MRNRRLTWGMLMASFGWLGISLAGALAQTMNTPLAPVQSQSPTNQTGLATLGGGCFWCVEAVFLRVPGVLAVTNGYAGGTKPDPSYGEVCDGGTGHAEVIHIQYDTNKVTYERLIEVFWKAHDPTTWNRQGADEGTQYRSIILYHDAAQKKAAETAKRTAARMFDRPVVTEIVPLKQFYPAEAYHQNYFQRNPEQAYCRRVIAPKVQKLEKEMKLPSEPERRR